MTALIELALRVQLIIVKSHTVIRWKITKTTTTTTKYCIGKYREVQESTGKVYGWTVARSVVAFVATTLNAQISQ